MRCPTKVQTVRSAALNQCRYSIKERRPHNRPRGFPLRSVLLPMSVAGLFTVQQDEARSLELEKPATSSRGSGLSFLGIRKSGL